MKISLTIVVIALILNLSLISTLKLENNKNTIEKNSNLNENEIKGNKKVLDAERKYYKETEISAENFLFDISHLVLNDFKILKNNNLTGITFDVLKNMIHSDKDFGNNITDEELKKKFKEYDVSGKGELDKITYSGILSEFMLAKAALKKLNKYFEETSPISQISSENKYHNESVQHHKQENYTSYDNHKSNHTEIHDFNNTKGYHSYNSSEKDHQYYNSTKKEHHNFNSTDQLYFNNTSKENHNSNDNHYLESRPKYHSSNSTKHHREQDNIMKPAKVIYTNSNSNQKKEVEYDRIQYVTPIIKKRTYN